MTLRCIINSTLVLIWKPYFSSGALYVLTPIILSLLKWRGLSTRCPVISDKRQTLDRPLNFIKFLPRLGLWTTVEYGMSDIRSEKLLLHLYWKISYIWLELPNPHCHTAWWMIGVTRISFAFNCLHIKRKLAQLQRRNFFMILTPRL